MAKKCLLALVLTVFAAGVIFAQANNTITIDLGPTIVGASIKTLGKMIDEDGVSSSGFGIAAQYERQIIKQLGVAGRFAFLKGGVGYTDEVDFIKVNLGLDMTSFSIEGHGRFYPGGETFFLGGMLGFGRLTTALSGDAAVDISGFKRKEKVSYTVGRNYFKLGAKVGWRISFGKNGGVTFEPSIGYNFGIGVGDTIGKRLTTKVFDDLGGSIDGISDIDEAFKLLENFIFIGGPRVTLAFGYRF